MAFPQLRPMTRIAAGLFALTLALAGCGDDDTEADPGADNVPASTEDTSTEADGAAGGSSPADVITEAAEGDGEVDLDDAMAALSPETRFDIVASQLEPVPSIEIDGTDIRLVFDGGSVDNAIIDCIIAGVTATDDEVVTLVYPDGEEVC